MKHLGLTSSEFDRLLKILLWLAGGVWALLLLIQLYAMKAEMLTAAFRSFSGAVTISVVLFGLVYKVAWRWPLVASWMRRPIVHGVWRGELRSNYNRDPDSPPLIVPIVFVIRQTYLTISLQSFTPTQDGESKLEALVQSEKHDSTELSYLFELRRLVGGENKLTTGAGQLKLLDGNKLLRGHYWTNSPTRGEARLELLARNVEGVDCYEVAEKKWPRASVTDNATLPS
jgi:hypothetical protein